MHKHELLQAISELHRKGEISRSEVLSALGEEHGAHIIKGLRVTDVLYFIGGIIVLAGVAVFIGQHWEQLNSWTRVLVTLGSGFAAYTTGMTFLQQRNERYLSGTFFFLSMLLIPSGIAVALHEWSPSANIPLAYVLISALSFLTYCISFFVFKKRYFLASTIFFGTWLFLALTNWMVADHPVFNAGSFMEYRILFVGLTYMMFGYAFRNDHLSTFTGPLYTIGSIFFLGSAFALGGFERDVFTTWEFVFPFLCFGLMFLSTIIRSSGFLFIAAFFLMIDIFKLTAEYFTGSFGWPLSLVLCGLAIIIIGYATLRVQQRFIKASVLPH